MEVKINREIRNYTESMFFGLSLRQFIFSVLACGVAVGLYFLLKPHFGTETVSWVCILGAAPFAALGFVKYNGMTAEKFIWAWIKSCLLYTSQICELTRVLKATDRKSRRSKKSSTDIRLSPSNRKKRNAKSRKSIRQRVTLHQSKRYTNSRKTNLRNRKRGNYNDK